MGFSGKKAAKDFTSAERGAHKTKYSFRKVFWDKISKLVRAGHTTTDIILNVSKATVCRVRKRLEDGESIEDRPRSGRPTKLTPDATKVKVFSSEKKMTRSP